MGIYDAQVYPTGVIDTVSIYGGFVSRDYIPPEILDEGSYAETCASIGIMFFARQILRKDLSSGYRDAMECALSQYFR